MKIRLHPKTVCCVLTLFISLDNVAATTLSFSGELDIGFPFPDAPYLIMGITYLQFVMDQPGHFDYSTTYRGGDFFRVSLFTGTQGTIIEPLDYRWHHYSLGEGRLVGSSSGDLSSGHYLLTVSGENVEWSWSINGYEVLSPLEEQTDVPGSPMYTLALNGDFRPVSLWEGQLDGTFRVTNYSDVPEPGTLSMAGAALAALSFRRRR